MVPSVSSSTYADRLAVEKATAAGAPPVATSLTLVKRRPSMIETVPERRLVTKSCACHLAQSEIVRAASGIDPGR